VNTSRRFLAVIVALALARIASAQNLALTQSLSARTLAVAGAPVAIDLRNNFGLTGVTGQVAQVDTVLGKINLELFADTPLTTANFFAYVNAGRYANTVVHRSVPGFVVQAGGYFSRVPLEHITTFPPVQNEFRRSNVRGTVAMAKIGGDPNSATSEWFVNLADNSAGGPALDTQNGGFTVFARVLGTGMTVVDAIAALPRTSDDVPLRDLTPAQLSGQSPATAQNLVTVNNVTAVPIYPAGGAAVLAFTVQNSNTSVVTATLNGSTLTLTPVSFGTANITVRATDTNGNNVESAFSVTVTADIAITTQPQSQYVSPGASITFTAAAQANGSVGYQWRKNGDVIAGATNASYTIASATAGDMGFYAVTATSGASTTTSNYAGLTVNTGGTSRLINLSTRGNVRAGESLTPGFVMRGVGQKTLVIRAVGPGLVQFGVPGVLLDPKMEIIPLGGSTVVQSNDDWGVPVTNIPILTAASAGVGAFALPAGSRDAALLANFSVSGTGGYTVGMTATSSTASGAALAEIYDADPPTSPVRLINVSTLAFVDTDGLTPGFVIGGTAPKLVMIRAVGPTIGAAPFSVGGTLDDPQLSVVPLGRNFVIASNNDWGDGGQTATLQQAFVQSGAFSLQNGSKDAVVLIRLPPGGYTATASGVGGTTGRALIEVYDLDP
jgi:cyclophilin family peptidyl-prolyl cis-trans isomerase